MLFTRKQMFWNRSQSKEPQATSSCLIRKFKTKLCQKIRITANRHHGGSICSCMFYIEATHHISCIFASVYLIIIIILCKMGPFRVFLKEFLTRQKLLTVLFVWHFGQKANSQVWKWMNCATVFLRKNASRHSNIFWGSRPIQIFGFRFFLLFYHQETRNDRYLNRLSLVFPVLKYNFLLVVYEVRGAFGEKNTT